MVIWINISHLLCSVPITFTKDPRIQCLVITSNVVFVNREYQKNKSQHLSVVLSLFHDWRVKMGGVMPEGPFCNDIWKMLVKAFEGLNNFADIFAKIAHQMHLVEIIFYLNIQFTIQQYCFKQWLGIEQATVHYLNQRCRTLHICFNQLIYFPSNPILCQNVICLSLAP